jgi:hypothetical protein
MKTAPDLPDDVVRSARRRVQLPLVECAHEARQNEEITPERIADVLLEEEAEGHRDVRSASDPLAGLFQHLPIQAIRKEEAGLLAEGVEQRSDLWD